MICRFSRIDVNSIENFLYYIGMLDNNHVDCLIKDMTLLRRNFESGGIEIGKLLLGIFL